HKVINQPPELVDYNLYDTDAALREGVLREGGSSDADSLFRYGALLGQRENFRLAAEANRHGPELQAYDMHGHRVDRILFHPAWTHFMALTYGQGMHSGGWAESRPGAQVARAAAYLMHGQIEAGSQC